MLSECIILAGGLGTRLQSVVNDVPKVLADINGKPFLHYLLEEVTRQNISDIILSVGYKHELIQSFCKQYHPDLNIKYAIEKEPLGTGGGIALALKLTISSPVLIINGDTFFKINYDTFYDLHQSTNSSFSIALKPMNNFDRYGSVIIDEKKRITGFREKQFQKEGTINAGVYLLNKKDFLKLIFQQKFSFEKDFMEQYYSRFNMHGFSFDNYFIDIGIPKDYHQAQQDFKTMFPQ